MKHIQSFKMLGYDVLNNNQCDICISRLGILEANQQLLFIPEVTMG